MPVTETGTVKKKMAMKTSPEFWRNNAKLSIISPLRRGSPLPHPHLRPKRQAHESGDRDQYRFRDFEAP
jgi:hypothetical protein